MNSLAPLKLRAWKLCIFGHETADRSETQKWMHAHFSLLFLIDLTFERTGWEDWVMETRQREKGGVRFSAYLFQLVSRAKSRRGGDTDSWLGLCQLARWGECVHTNTGELLLPGCTETFCDLGSGSKLYGPNKNTHTQKNTLKPPAPCYHWLYKI